jgi:hypothetical protein
MRIPSIRAIVLEAYDVEIAISRTHNVIRKNTVHHHSSGLTTWNQQRSRQSAEKELDWKTTQSRKVNRQ